MLLEDIPGVGKTTLAMAFSRAMGLSYRRVQFTPDVLPSDLTGFSIYRREEEKFVYQPGSVFCNLLLADEINRTSPKTQSALLEVMEERRVTVLDDWTLLKMQEEIHDVFVRDRVYAYILELIRATQENPHFERGASPRGTIALVKMAKAAAYLAGRDYVIPADVEEQFYYVSAHRVMLSGAARMEGLCTAGIIDHDSIAGAREFLEAARLVESFLSGE